MNSADAVALLRVMAVKGVGPASAGRLLDGLHRAGLTPSQALEQPAGRAILAQFLKPEQLQALALPNPRVQEQAHKCEAMGVQFISIRDPEYPASLRQDLKTPPVMLAYLGNVALLSRKGVGFCGSRSASEKGITTATDIAEQLARVNLVVVSGHAAGVDQAAHRAALKAGGSTTIVLPEGILHFHVRRELEDVWDWGRVLVVSEFGPGIPWSAPLAMQRNRTILGLSDAMILIEAGEKGGSMAAGQEALAMKRPLFAPVYDGMPPTAVGNRMLLERGAQPLKKRRSTGEPNLEKVLEVVRQSERLSRSEPASRPETGDLQLALVG